MVLDGRNLKHRAEKWKSVWGKNDAKLEKKE
jgi:hypothetical protein